MDNEFYINQEVKIQVTGVTGTVTGVAKYRDSSPSYLVEYSDETKALQEHWLKAAQLQAA